MKGKEKVRENTIELFRLKVNINGNIHLPKALREEFGIEHKSEVIFGLFELLRHGEISQLPSFDVKFV